MKKLIFVLPMIAFLMSTKMGSGDFGESFGGSFLGSTLSNVMWELPRQRSYRSSGAAASAAMEVARSAHTIAVDTRRGVERLEDNLRRELKDIRDEIRRLRDEIRNLKR